MPIGQFGTLTLRALGHSGIKGLGWSGTQGALFRRLVHDVPIDHITSEGHL